MTAATPTITPALKGKLTRAANVQAKAKHAGDVTDVSGLADVTTEIAAVVGMEAALEAASAAIKKAHAPFEA